MSDAAMPEQDVEVPVVIPIEAYVSADYARAENEKLWPKVWQSTCRVEEIPTVGDYVTYDILDESIIVVRAAADQISAYYNVCQHRGRRLTKGCGHTNKFYCPFHGWTWDIEGKNIFALDREDWRGALSEDDIRLKSVRVDTWAGWVFINMDPEAEPLSDYLGEAKTLLDPYELERMRFKWRKWLHFPCNWKTALEAFIESYHVHASHPQLQKWVSHKYWSRAKGRHGHHGVAAPRGAGERGGSGLSGVSVRGNADPRVAIADQLIELAQTLDATSTLTVLNAAQRLVHELPEGASSGDVAAHLMASAQRDDAARGVTWPSISHEQMEAAGFDWLIFPNLVILQGPTFALVYRARPNDYDPNSCIFEVCALERYPDGEEPKTEWVYESEPSQEKWRLILSQDFGNMPEVQKGMKSRGFVGPRPNPFEEVAVANFHRALAEYMGTGAPVPLGEK